MKNLTFFTVTLASVMIGVAFVTKMLSDANDNVCNHHHAVDKAFCRMGYNLKMTYDVVCSNQQVIYNAVYELKQIELENSRKLDLILKKGLE